MVKDKVKQEIRHYRRRRDQDEAVIFGISFGASILAMLSIFSYKKKEYFSFGMLITTLLSALLNLINYIFHLKYINKELKELEDWSEDEAEDFFYDIDKDEVMKEFMTKE